MREGISWFRSLRALLAAGLAASLLALPGCLTDGSIPVGGGSGNGVLRGTIVHAEDPDLSFPGARITLRSPDGLVLQQRSDEQGNWEFVNVPDGRLEALFEGAQPGYFLPVKVDVQTAYASFATIAIAMEPARMSVPDVTEVSVTPVDSQVLAGDKIRFTSSVTGGDPLRKATTWVVEGGIGSINARGEFTAIRPGMGVVRAIAGGVSGAAAVEVKLPPVQ